MSVPAIQTFQVQTIPVHRIELPTPFPVGPVNVYLIPYEGRLILVDTGVRSDEVRASLESAFHHLGYRLEDLDEIHLTHHHVDHCGLTHWLCSLADVQVYGHPDIPAYLDRAQRHDAQSHAYYMDLMERLGVPDDKAEEAMMLWNQFKSYTKPFSVHTVYEEGEAASLFTPYFVPGHSATDTLLVFNGAATALAGDHVLADISPNPLMRRALPGRAPAKALVEYRESLGKTQKMQLERCFTGHGPVIDDVEGVIEKIDQRHENRNRKIMNLIRSNRQGCITPFQLCMLLFPRLDIANLYLGLSVSLGHLELLEDRQVLELERDSGILYYKQPGGENE